MLPAECIIAALSLLMSGSALIWLLYENKVPDAEAQRLRELPDMMSTKLSEFLTPSSLVRIWIEFAL